MTTNPAMRSRNSFWKAMLLAVIAASIVAVLQATSGKGADAAGYATGYFAGPPIFAGLAVGIWAKLAKSPWTWRSYIWRFGVGTIAFFVLASMGEVLSGSMAMARITDSEKQHLVISGTEARHADFGFTVPLPSADFQLSPEMQKQANAEFESRSVAAGNYAWVLKDAKRGEVVIVMVTKGAGNSRAALQGLGRGLNVGAGKTGGQVLEDTMEWSPAAHEYRFALMSQSMYLRARCLSSMTTGTSSYILCVETVSADPRGLNEARAGVRLASWK